MSDLEEVITNSIEDATIPEETPDPVVDTPDPVDIPSDPVVDTPPADPVDPVTPESIEVKSPAAQTPEVKVEPDAFEKKYGIPAQVNGRENRIPHTRVRKMVEKAEADVKSIYEPKIQAHEATIKDQSVKLDRVAAFEKVMVEEKPRFLQMLRTIPGYAELLDAAKAAPIAQVKEEAPVVVDEMPQPDQESADGFRTYSMDGLKALEDWNRKQTKAEVLKEIETQYGPIRTKWEAEQKIEAARPLIEAQINKARTWPQFNENEEAIVTALQTDPSLSLEGAYRQVVFTKMDEAAKVAQVDRTKLEQEIRAKVLADIKKAPTHTAAPVAGGVKPEILSNQNGPRTLEDVIREEIDKSGLRR